MALYDDLGDVDPNGVVTGIMADQAPALVDSGVEPQAVLTRALRKGLSPDQQSELQARQANAGRVNPADVADQLYRESVPDLPPGRVNPADVADRLFRDADKQPTGKRKGKANPYEAFGEPVTNEYSQYGEPVMGAQSVDEAGMQQGFDMPKPATSGIIDTAKTAYGLTPPGAVGKVAKVVAGGLVDAYNSPEGLTGTAANVARDTVTGWKRGMNETARAGRELVSRLPAGETILKGLDEYDRKAMYPEATGDMGEFLKKRSEQLFKEYTPETQAAKKKDFIDEKNGYALGEAWTDWRSYAFGLIESVPEQILTMAPAMKLAKWAYSAKVAAGATADVAGKFAGRVAYLAGGLSEGGLAGAHSAIEVRDHVNALPQEVLNQSDAYKALLASGLSPDAARKAIAEDASTQAFITSGVVTSLFGGVGDRAIAKIFTEKTTKSLAGNVVKGAVAEGVLEEAPQSGGSKIAENVAKQKADPNQRVMQGVANETVSGAVLGSIMGGGMAAGASMGKPEREHVRIDTEHDTRTDAGAAAGAQPGGLPPPDDAGVHAGGPGDPDWEAKEERDWGRWWEQDYGGVGQDGKPYGPAAAGAAAPPEGGWQPFESTLKPKTRQKLNETAQAFNEHSEEEIASWDDNKLKDYLSVKYGAGSRRDPDDMLRKAGMTDAEVAGMAPKQKAAFADELLNIVADINEGTRYEPIDLKTAEDVRRAEARIPEDRTPAQMEAGVAERGHTTWNGLRVSLEVPKGGIRKGIVKETGKEWQSTHPHPYGELLGVPKAADGMLPDIVMGDDPSAPNVYVIDELDRKTGKYKQSKAYGGFHSPEEVKQSYLGISTKKPEQIGAITAMPREQFRTLAKAGGLSKPLAWKDGNKVLNEAGTSGGDAVQQDSLPDRSASVLPDEPIEATQEHHDAIEKMLREHGIDADEVRPADVAHAADLHAQGMEPRDAFIAAVQDALISGAINKEAAEQELGHAAIQTILDAGDGAEDSRPATEAGRPGTGRPEAEAAEGKAPGVAQGEPGKRDEAPVAEADGRERQGTGAVHPAQGTSPAAEDRRETAEPAEGLIGERVESISEHKVTDAANNTITVVPVVVEAADLITSSDPGYDARLQPRNRDRAASQAQIREIATRLNPERLGYSAEADRGAPIVGPDRMTESGNGRIAALRKLYAVKGPNATKYREWLQGLGVDVSKFKEPILVRQRITPFDQAKREAFTVAANQSATLNMSAPERAMADARYLTPNMLGLIQDAGNLKAAANRPFHRAFVAAIPSSEHGTMVGTDGSLSPDGATRARNAVLAKAYGDADLIEHVTDTLDDEIKSISNALIIASPDWAKFRADVDAGKVREELDLTDGLVAAVKRTADIRARGDKLGDALAQHDAFDHIKRPVESWMRLFYDAHGQRAASASSIAEGLRTYAEQARLVTNDPRLFALEEVSADDIGQLAADRAQGTVTGRKTRNGPNRDAHGTPAKGRGVREGREAGAGRDEPEPRLEGLADNPDDLFAPRAEPGAEGKPQLVIPGAERVSGAELAKRRAAEPLKPKVAQKPVQGGLFGDEIDQTDLVDAVRTREAEYHAKADGPDSTRRRGGSVEERRGYDAAKAEVKEKAPEIGVVPEPQADVSKDDRRRLNAIEKHIRTIHGYIASHEAAPKEGSAEAIRRLTDALNNDLYPQREAILGKYRTAAEQVSTAAPSVADETPKPQIESGEQSNGSHGDRVRQAAPAGDRELAEGRAGKAQSRPRKRGPGPDQLSLFGGGGSEGPVRRPDIANAAQPGDAGAAVSGAGGEVTKPPGGRKRNRPRGDSQSGAAGGLKAALKKIAERARLNYRITDEDRIGQGGPKEKVRGNLEAIRTLKAIEDEARQATPEEKAILVKYVGWGSVAQELFDENRYSPHREKWKTERAALLSLLTEEEYAAARASTPNAHYTSPEVIRGMWAALNHLGFKGGEAIEPSAGVGHFIGLVPDAIAPKTSWTAVELDPITGRIAKLLYAGAEVNVQGYETLKRPSNYYDLVVSNVPFGDYNISEKPYGSYPIHDFFFVKSLDKVRPGGVVAFITSRFTMDRVDDGTRRLLSRTADLVGAIRLPGGKTGAFAGNAGTEVTTDIIFLRKRVPGEAPFPRANWWKLKEIQTPDGPVKINEYFADRPGMMLGEMRLQGTMYRDNEPVLIGSPEGITEKIAQAAENMPPGAFVKRGAPPAPETMHGSEIDGSVKDGAFFVQDGKVFQKKAGQGFPQTSLSHDDADRIKRLVGIRDIVNDLLATQVANGDNAAAQSEHLRSKLQHAYQSFVRKYGPINREERTVTSRKDKQGEPIVTIRQTNFAKFKPDPDSWKVAAIENYDAETDTAKPADIQTKDVIAPKLERTINGPADALAASLDDTGGVDLDHIAESLGMDSPDEAAQALGDLIYQDPDGRLWQTADRYLSGDVVKKLEDARALAEIDKSYQRNVDALEKVQPTPLTRAEITAQFGAPWVPEAVYEDFIKNELGASGKVKVSRVALTGDWRTGFSGVSRDAQSKFGTDSVTVKEVVDHALNNQQITVYFPPDDDGKRAVNPKATEEARVRVDLLKEAFSGDPDKGIDGWVWSDDERARQLEAIYNRTYNNLVAYQADGSHQTLPGLNRDFATRKHRLDAIWRIIQNGNTLLAHAVGSGKTVTMIAAGMEMKRLGLINKPAYVVPNHMLEQFSREFIQAYPNAKILVASKEETSRDNRKAFLAKASANDWDGVIITHDAFGRINMGFEWRHRFVLDQLNELDRVIKAEQSSGDKKSPTVKALEKLKKKLNDKLTKLMNEDRKDDGVTFEESGIDHLFVDEAHKFKNLAFITRMQRVKGLSQGDSQRAEDLFLKIRYLEGKRPGRSAVFATGTPVSNTMAELWTMMRYLQLDKLRERDLDLFDSWASTFGKVVTETVLSPDGRTMRDESSFSRFVNVPELIGLYGEIADTKTADMLNLPRPIVETKSGAPGIEIIKAAPSGQEEAYINDLVKLAESLKGKRPAKGEPNMLSVVTMGRKVATDGRMVGLDYNPEGKIAKLVNNVVEIYREGKEPGLVQMIFLDMGVPQSRSAAKPKINMKPETGEELLNTLDQIADLDSLDPMLLEVPKINLYQDIKDRLIEQGIPAKEIAFIHDAPTDDKKARLFAKVRAGEVRVFLGSSEKMGVGTNVQDRLIVMHHMDAPWKPAEVEQRDGRIVRQGNKNPKVRILRYVTEKSFDAFMWQKLDTKSKFIGQVLSGAKGSRHAEDVDSPLPEAAEMKAAASGDPRIMEHADLERIVRQLAAQRRAFESTRSRADWEAGQAQSRLKQYEDALPSTKIDAANVKDISGDKFLVTLNGLPMTDRREAGTLILDRFIKLDPRSFYTRKIMDVGQLSGLQMQMDVEAAYRAGETHLYVTPMLKGERAYASSTNLVINEQTDPIGLMRRFESILSAVGREPARVEAVIADERKNVQKLEATLGQRWPKEKEYQEAVAKRDALTAELKPKPEQQAPVPGTDVATEGLSDNTVEFQPKPPHGATPQEAAEIKAMIEREAPAQEIAAHPAVVRAVAKMRSQVPTGTIEDFNNPEWRAARVYDFDGEKVHGWDEAVKRLVAKAESYAGGEVAQENRAVIVLGPPAAGKSSVSEPIARAYQAAIVDPDDAKLVIPEYQGGVGTQATHEESSYLAKDVAKVLGAQGKNIVFPKVGNSEQGTVGFVEAWRGIGYSFDIAHVAATPEISARRNIMRWLQTGRLVDPEFIAQTGDKPRSVAYILRGQANDYASADTSQSPETIEGTGRLAELLRNGSDERSSPDRSRERDSGREEDASEVAPDRLSDNDPGFTPRVTDTPAFKSWFGDSKVVDENGRPLVVYHGTDVSGFDRFERTEDIGFHFGTASQANERASVADQVGDGNVIPVYLRIDNPLRLPDLGTWDPEDVLTALVDANVLSQSWADLAAYENTLIDRDFVKRALQAKGYDGIVYLNMGEGGVPTEERGGFTRDESHESLRKRFPEAGDSFIVFEPTQIKSATGNSGAFDPANPSILADNDERFTAPVFYSATAKAIENAKQNKAAPNQWLGMLRNSPGVKPEEIEWLGLEGWLRDHKGPVTKEALAEYVRAHEIQVKDVTKGGSVPPKAVDAIADWLRNEYGEADREAEITPADLMRLRQGDADVIGRLEGIGVPSELLQPVYDNLPLDDDGLGGATKFGQYVLPGGENYRELLLTLPPQNESIVLSEARPPGHEYGSKEFAAMWQGRHRVEGVTQYDFTIGDQTGTITHWPADSKSWNGPNPEGPDGTFIVNTHGMQNAWFKSLDIAKRAIEDSFNRAGEQRGGDYMGRQRRDMFKSSHWDEPNVIAHVRFNDRVIDGKRTLFIEEVQSDWHQKGKKQGYMTPIPAKDRPAAIEKLHSMEKELDDLGYSNRDTSEYQALEAQIGDLRGKITGMTGVPDAPFKTTWPELALKRMVRYAAENGYDAVAWTPGEVQAARYDLSKHISKVTYDPKYKVLHADDLKGNQVIRETVEPAKVADYVGKDVAEKLLSAPIDHWGIHKLSGLDLKVGGEGMLRFYDDILPATVNKLGKKYGARVRTAEIDTKPERGPLPEGSHDFSGRFKSVHTLPITPELRDVAMNQGFALFDNQAGRAASGIDPGPSSRENVPLARDIQRHVIHEGIATGQELLVAVDERGELLEHTFGEHGFVTVDKAMKAKLADPANSIVVHHNHPSNTGLSILDIGWLAMPGLHGLWAHGHGGNVARGSLTPAARAAFKNMPAQAARDRLFKAASDLSWGFHKALQQAIYDDAVTEEDAKVAFSELVARALDHAGVIDYQSNADIAGLVDKLKLQPLLEVATRAARTLLNDQGTGEGLRRRSNPSSHLGDVGAVFTRPEETAGGRADAADADRERGTSDQAEEDGAPLDGLAERQPSFRARPPRYPIAETIGAYLELHNNSKLARVAAKVIGPLHLEKINPVEVRVKLQDRFLRWKQAEKAVERETGQPIPEDMQTYMAESLFHGRTGQQLETLDTEHIDPLVADMQKRGLTAEGVGEFLYARHAGERNARLRPLDPSNHSPSGMSDDEARATLQGIFNSPKRGDYGAVEGRVRRIINETIETQVRGGLLSREMADAWKASSRRYVPLRGWAEGVDDTMDGNGTGQGFSIRGPESKRALGRRSRADNPLGYVLQQAQQAIIRAEKNKVFQTAHRFVRNYPDPNVWSTERAPTKRVVDPDTGMIKHVVDQGWANQKNAVYGKIDGVPHRILFHGPYGENLARAFNNLGTTNTPALLRTWAQLTRIQSRLNTSLNPDFTLANVVRDFGEAVINMQAQQQQGFTKAFMKHYGPAMAGSLQALRGNFSGEYAKAFREFDEAGGRIRFLGLTDIEDIKHNIDRKMRRLEGGVVNGAKDIGGAVIDGIEIANGALENATRLAAYMAARDVGLSKAKAAELARDMTLNFNRQGEWGNIIKALYMFANPAIQGTERMMRALTSKHSRRLAYGLAGIAASLAVFNIFAGGDDDDGVPYYLKLTPWERDANLIIMWPKGMGKDGLYAKIPLPYGYSFFGVIGARTASMAFAKEKASKAVPAMFKSILDAFDPFGHDQNLIAQFLPTLMKPAVHLWTNVNWTGRPISPQQEPWNKYEPDSQRTFRSDSEFSKRAAEGMNKLTGGTKHEPGKVDLTPGTVDYMLGFVTGGAGRFAMNVADTVWRGIQGQEWNINKTPILRRFAGKIDLVQANRALYYEDREEVMAAHARQDKYSKDKPRDKDQISADRHRAEHKAELAAYSKFQDTDNRRRQLYKDVDEIKHDKSLTAAQRDKQIKAKEEEEVGRMNEARKLLATRRKEKAAAGL